MKRFLYMAMIALAAIALTVIGCSEPEEKDNSVIVTFDSNGGDTDPEPATRKVAPGTAVKLPEIPPTKAGYTFLGYNREEDGSGAPFVNNAVVRASIKVYAQWDDGKAKFVDGKIVHNIPAKAFEISGSVAYNEEDGTFKLTGGGGLDYLFPTDVKGENANDYDYFIILTKILSGESGSGTGIQMKTYKSSVTDFGGSTGNKMPWLSNPDGQKIVLEVSGAGTGTNKGFRIHVPSTVVVDKMIINSITFYKLPRYTVTFDYNYTGKPADKVVTGVMGGDGNVKSPGVTAGKWPTAPTNDPNFFLGWFDNGGTMYTATTPIEGSITLLARWSTTEPQGWMEQVTTNGTSVPVYGFNIPVNGKLGDYTKLIVKINPGTNTVKGRFRVWGPYAATGFASGGLETAVTAASGPNMQNAVDGLLVTTKGTYTDSITLNEGSDWEEITLDISPSVMDAKYHSGTDGSGKTFFTEATGIQLLGLGIIAAGGGSDSRTYIIKDIRLENNDGSKKLEVMDPKDPLLFSDGGQTIYVKQDKETVFRTRMYP